MVSPQGILKARDSLEYWDKRRTAVARGQAVVIQDKQRLHADILTAYLTPTSSDNKTSIRTDSRSKGSMLLATSMFQCPMRLFEEIRENIILRQVKQH